MLETIGQLRNVDLRSQWPKEELDFTPWLASEPGLALLSDALGLDLELEGKEVAVGRYSADIVAKDVSSSNRVVVENQFGKTDHDHLGKCITYASGLEAKTMVWIAEKFTDEHRRALDFLNETAAPGLQFFGLEMELWRIGNSAPAPHFKLISSPNDYLASARKEERGFGEADALYRNFWTKFRDFCGAQKSSLPLRTPQPQSWMPMAIGRSDFSVNVTASKQKRRVGCELYIHGAMAKKAFELLELQKKEIEEVTGPLEWQELPQGSDCRIAVYKTGIDIAGSDGCDTPFAWLRENAERLFDAFRERVKSLDLDSERPEAT